MGQYGKPVGTNNPAFWVLLQLSFGGIVMGVGRWSRRRSEIRDNRETSQVRSSVHLMGESAEGGRASNLCRLFFGQHSKKGEEHDCRCQYRGNDS